jgi:hypothetical protein
MKIRSRGLGSWDILQPEDDHYVIPYGDHKILIDGADIALALPYTWYVTRNGNVFYAATDSGARLYLHRLIGAAMGMPGRVEHADRNGLNCMRSNLRPATHQQNVWNTGKRNMASTSRFKGVSWHKRSRLWRANIRVNGKQSSLGYFRSEEDAAAAYDTAALKDFGEYACTNVMLGLLPEERLADNPAGLAAFRRAVRSQP